MMRLRYLALAIMACLLVFTSCDSGDGSAVAKTNEATKKTETTTTKTVNTTPIKKAKTPTPIEGGMEWLSFDEVDKMSNKGDKKYLVDVYTSWCGWCKVMDKQTFTDDKVKDYVGENFHPVKFDAERKTPIPFNGKDYEWMPGGRKGINKLAVELLGGRMSYPSLVYLDKNMNKIKVSPGFKKPDQLLTELKALENM